MITAVAGIRVGHWTDRVGLTGCTVILPPAGTVASCEVRGGAPGTRETDLLRPGMLVQGPRDPPDGRQRLRPCRRGRRDALPARARDRIRDAGRADPDRAGGGALRPRADRPMRVPTPKRAMPPAWPRGGVSEGNVGAGTGATVAKLRGPEGAIKGGLGTASITDDDLVVGALAAVNALGENRRREGSAVAWDRNERPNGRPGARVVGNTTLVVVATDARLSKERANLLARAAHDGISRAVRPSHTMWDGDTVFALATGTVDADQRRCERLAEPVVAEAIRRAVRRVGTRLPRGGWRVHRGDGDARGVGAHRVDLRALQAGTGRTQVVFGVGSSDANVMFVGEGPGFHEDKQGIPFVGAAGQLLDRMLGEIGLLRADVYIANVVRCRPPGNRDPLPDEIDACRPWLLGTIERSSPG